MPLPMVHLAIAVQAHKLISSEPTPAFLLGSIAPDAIHMRPNTTRNDKQKTHLWFKSLKQEPMIEPAYITAAVVQAFVLETASVLTKHLSEWKQRRVSS